MIRILKSIGIAFVGALAMGVLGASAAKAVPSFTCSAYPCAATGDTVYQTEVFTTEAGKIQCTGHFESHSMGSASSTITLTPTYLYCSAFGFSASMNTEDCSYVLHATEQSTLTAWLSHLDISCPEKESIKISAMSGACKAEIKAQHSLTTVRLENAAGALVVRPEVRNLTYTVTADGFGCPFSGTGAKTGGAYTSNGVNITRDFGGTISASGS